MDDEKIKVLHITPHLGGGIGKALTGLSVSAKKFKIQSAIVLLEQPEKEETVCYGRKAGIEIYIKPDYDRLSALVRESDAVIINWWNHPLMNQFLYDFHETCRLLVWCHVNGCVYPYFDSRFLVQFNHIFFTSPYSVQNLLWDAPARKEIADKSMLVYGFGNFDPEQIKCRSSWKRNGRLKIGYAGTLNYSKMLPEFINYCDCICRMLDRVEFHFAGDPDQEFLNDVQSSEFKDRFYLDGYISDMYHWYRDMDIFLYLLNEKHYGTTENAILEAMCTGMPVIAMDHGVERHIFQNGKAGILIHNEKEAGDAIRLLSDDESARRRQGMRNRKYVCCTFSSAVNVERFSRKLEHLISCSKKSYDFRPVLGDEPYEWFLSAAGLDREIFTDFFDHNDVHALSELLKEKEIYRVKTKSSIIQFARYFPEDERLDRLKSIIELKGYN